MTETTPAIYIKDYDYPLPPERIAQHPLDKRDASKLLIFNHGKLQQDIFTNVGDFLPSDSLLVFNDTRVIRARLLFYKPTGTRIEIFCLEPVAPSSEIQEAFHQQGACSWKCLVGNMKRWKEGCLVKELDGGNTEKKLYAEVVQREQDGSVTISFRWEPVEMTFSEVLERAGLVPLPPYIERDTDQEDIVRYQTVYAANDGSVAAPTAGLHFTENLMARLTEAGHTLARVTLHVGVGTFRPVTSETIAGHQMHSEKIVVTRQTVESLLAHSGKSIISVGTTSARTIESLYWMGVNISAGNFSNPFSIDQWAPYRGDQDIPDTHAALQSLRSYMIKNKVEEIHGETRLLIMPGYVFRIISGLITNFHMPQSTLLLLVSALAGNRWRDAYSFALENDFRFLSYGDACLFFAKVDTNG